MRVAFYLTFFVLLSMLSCRKHKSELEKLPAETQTGVETFGCLVNGKVFKPKGSPFGGPILSCAYQYVNGGYSFQLHAKQRIGDVLLSVGVFTDSLAIAQGATIPLFERFIAGKGYGLHGRYISGSEPRLYLTQASGTGELHITKLDETSRIVSGTFWFDGVNDDGEKVEVREGRFDVHYTL